MQQINQRVNQIPQPGPMVDTATRNLTAELKKRDGEIQKLQAAVAQLAAQVKTLQPPAPATGQKAAPTPTQAGPTGSVPTTIPPPQKK